MNSATVRYITQNKKILQYILLVVGAILILYGVFRDPTWLKSIHGCMAMDGICVRHGVLNSISIIVTSTGCLLAAFALRGGPVIFVNNNRFELFLELGILVLMALFLISSQMRFIDNDEYEHLHNAWLMTQGTIPYYSLKFWQSPLPLLEWTIACMMRFTGENTIIMQAMRLFIFCVSCGSLWIIYRIVKELYQSRVHALVAVLLVISNYIWIHKTPEIRPDNFMLFFVLLSFWFLIKLHADFKTKYLPIFFLCAVLAVFGKLNAAVPYLFIGLIFAYFSFANRKAVALRILIIVLVVMGLLLIFEPVRSFFMINIDRHFVPVSNRISPNGFLQTALIFNPSVFLLFILQLFFTYKLSHRFIPFRYYLYAVSIGSFVFLYIINRPLTQEMIVMVVFMSIVGANFLVFIIRKLKFKLEYILVAAIMFPALSYMWNTGLAKSWTKDLQTSKTILRISKRDDLVFDSFGKSIFRHSPMEPQYLMYNPSNFNRLEELKKSRMKYLIVDGYTNGLPLETRKWFYENFMPSKVDQLIWVRRNK